MFKPTLILLISFSAHAQLKSQLELFGSSTYERNASQFFNPGNRTLELPTWQQTFELRPDLQYQFSNNDVVVLRSRHLFQSTQIELTGPPEMKTTNQGRSDLSDFYWSGPISEETTYTLGLQNYQWGPGEILSPSNPFFHFNSEQRSFFYKEKGRVLLRANWNPSQKWSVVTIIEPMTNREAHWIADDTFDSQGAVKVEKQFDNPIDSLAIVLGKIEERTHFVAEHGNWSPAEGYSLYFDMRHQIGDFHYKHYTDISGFLYLDRKNDNPTQILTLALVGFRWEGRVDFRQEFIFNEPGYNKTEWAAVLQSVSIASPFLSQNLGRFFQPGLELRTKSYSYSSIRIPDLGTNNQISVSARLLVSLSENSNVLQLNYEHNLSDAMVASAEVIAIFGQANSEFRLLKEGQASLGLRWSH
jgi:hypothetical protein